MIESALRKNIENSLRDIVVRCRRRSLLTSNSHTDHFCSYFNEKTAI